MAASSSPDIKLQQPLVDERALTATVSPTSNISDEATAEDGLMQTTPQYRLYKRRFIGLAQIVLLNIIISWNWLSYASVSDLAADWYGVSESAINWMSTAFLFAFVAVTPFTLLAVHDPPAALVYAGVLTIVGGWLKWAGAARQLFGLSMFGQIIIGFAQPLVLTVPTRFSDIWFSDRGRVTATAIMSLANPLGGALGQLIGPLWASDASQISDMLEWTALMSTVIAFAALWTPKAPPTPPSAVAAQEKYLLSSALRTLHKKTVFWLVAVPFVAYVGLFNAVSSLFNQIFEPYGFSDQDAGLAGGILIIVGLVAAAITSPLVDRTKAFLPAIRILVPVVAASYVTLIFMPQTLSLAGSYVVCAILGASSFSLLPCALEYMAIVTNPISPEVSSILVWSAGQLAGAILLLIMDALKASGVASPPYNMYNALVFAACIACAAAPFPLVIGTTRWTTARVTSNAL